MQVVNGYVCKTSCDAVLAKQNINPSDPKDDVHNPKSPNYGKTEDAKHDGKPASAASPAAVTLSGALAKVTGATNAADTGSTPSSTYTPYSPGAVASISA
jgi:hypothetical protein